MKVLSASLLVFACVSGFGLAQSPGPQSDEDWIAPARAAKKKNPVVPDEKSIATGKSLYAQQCLTCHGVLGKGDGPGTKDLPKKVRDLADARVAADTDGSLFWKITTGRTPMPVYEKLLTEDERWHVINYVKALTAVEPRRALSSVIKPYLDVQAALFKDEFAAAQGAAKLFDETAHKLATGATLGLSESKLAVWTQCQIDLGKASAELAAAADLTASRAAFRRVSVPLIRALAAIGHSEPKPLVVFQCTKAFPDAPVTWLQVDEVAQNPFLGSKSPACGDIQSRLGAVPMDVKEGK